MRKLGEQAKTMDQLETDEELRTRLCKLPKVGAMWAEDIGNASGEDLEAIAEHFNTERQKKE